ncbi:acetoacetate--CoA ligase [Sesbania bispinosa]|nr:acetoacetate--CoA ligase [Sesbania bispinosa]
MVGVRTDDSRCWTGMELVFAGGMEYLGVISDGGARTCKRHSNVQVSRELKKVVVGLEGLPLSR